MPKVKLNTRYLKRHGAYHKQGDTLEVDDETAERWAKRGIATPQGKAKGLTKGGRGQAEVRKGGQLPEDFPGHNALAEAGIHTHKDLAAVEDLTEIPGIGEVTAAEIEAALADDED